MRRLLVANRGEIAKRVARAARERALPAVAVATREDEALAARYGANEIAPVASYADAEALLEVARSRGCDAVHPGYGFLSESAAFSRACGDAGLLFVGAPPAALALWGDKIAARDVAVASRVPVARGAVVRTASDLEAFLADAESAILKARTGGGGRGIREVARGDDLSEAMALCAAEGGRAFGGDDAAEGLVVEELVRGARHVEVQVVADASGAGRYKRLVLQDTFVHSVEWTCF